MPTYEDVVPALRWRRKGFPGPITAEALAAALTVGQLPYAKIPVRLWPSVRAFRRLRSDVRIAVARKFLMG